MTDISHLTLREKIGQMVMCGFEGYQPSDNIRKLIEDYKIGGIIYFSRNVESTKQVYQLSRELQQIAAQASDIPLYIAIDQEGGMVARIINGITLMPGNMALGATRSKEMAYKAAKVSGHELRALGINMNFAPSLDINNNPLNPVVGVRSYGDKPELVSDLGLAQVEGYQEENVCATIKHFPGHGDTNVDSHQDLPIIPHDLERIHKIELYPFKKVIQAGVDVIMLAHIVFPALENDKPSTLSEKVTNQLLRKELGYTGVVITDCFDMKAFSDNYGAERAAILAVEAGVDIILVSHTFERQVQTIEAIEKAVKENRISEERIDQSVQRILQLKQRRKLKDQLKLNTWDQALGQLNANSSIEIAREISEQSITVVKDTNQLLPLDRQKRTCVIWAEIRVSSEIDEVYDQQESLGHYLSQFISSIKEIIISTNPTDLDLKNVLKEAVNYEQVIMSTYNASLNPTQAELVRQLNSQLMNQQDKQLIVIATRNPYDLLSFSEVSTFIACYENRPLTMQSAAKVLMGHIQAKGKLPVTLSI